MCLGAGIALFLRSTATLDASGLAFTTLLSLSTPAILGGGGAILVGGSAGHTCSLIASIIISWRGFRDLSLGCASFACFLTAIFVSDFPPLIITRGAPGPGGGGSGDGCWLSLETSTGVSISLLLEYHYLPFLLNSVSRAA